MNKAQLKQKVEDNKKDWIKFVIGLPLALLFFYAMAILTTA